MSKVRTRFAPSPTGFMHVGNLRTALYEYLVAKSLDGAFVLRIEDTDRERYVDGAVDVIYNTLKTAGLIHDEGPDKGGEYGPYVQSERKDIYLPYAEELIKEGKAYRCFCTKERLEEVQNQTVGGGYDRHCRDLSQEEIDRLLEAGTPYVIRQKMPIDGETKFTDAVFGEITVDNSELQDQILIKADGYPTYNFANVIDDHTMGITHVVRGSEYLSSTPKYNLLYEGFGWPIPKYIHCSPVMRDQHNKMSKRHGDPSYEDLKNQGYLTDAIINYVALLGWSPRGDKAEQEVFSLTELAESFDLGGMSKSPAIFDINKLTHFNAMYLRAMTPEAFAEVAAPYIRQVVTNEEIDVNAIATLLQARCERLTEIPEKVDFFDELPEYDIEFFTNKKSKTTPEVCRDMLKAAIPALEAIGEWTMDAVHGTLIGLAESLGVKNATLMWPLRISIAGKTVTPGGAVEICQILGKDECIRRLKLGLAKL